MLGRGWLLGLTGSASDAVQMITSGITAWRSTGATQCFTVVVIIFGEQPMLSLANSMTLGAALAKRRLRLKQPRKGGSKPRFIALPGKSR